MCRYIKELVHISHLWPHENEKATQYKQKGDNFMAFTLLYLCYCNIEFSKNAIDVLLVSKIKIKAFCQWRHFFS